MFSTRRSSLIQTDLESQKQQNKELASRLSALQQEHEFCRQRESALLELLRIYRKNSPPTRTRSNDVEGDDDAGYACAYDDDDDEGPLSDSSSDCDSEDTMRAVTADPVVVVDQDLPTTISQLATLTKSLTSLATLVSGTTVLTDPSLSSTHADRFSTLVSTLSQATTFLKASLTPLLATAVTASAMETLLRFEPGNPLSPPNHPLQLDVYFHNLTHLLQKSPCPAASAADCKHTLNPLLNALFAVSIVHPGPIYISLKRSLLTAILGATNLRGECALSALEDGVFKAEGNVVFCEDWGWEGGLGVQCKRVDVFWDEEMMVKKRKRGSGIPVPVWARRGSSSLVSTRGASIPYNTQFSAASAPAPAAVEQSEDEDEDEHEGEDEDEDTGLAQLKRAFKVAKEYGYKGTLDLYTL